MGFIFDRLAELFSEAALEEQVTQLETEPKPMAVDENEALGLLGEWRTRWQEGTRSLPLHFGSRTR